MHKSKSQILLVVIVVALINSVTSTENSDRIQSLPDDLKEDTHRHLRGAVGTGSDVESDERGFDATKMKLLFNKSPSFSKLEAVLGKRADFSKVKIPAGQKLDLTQVKSLSGQKLDLTNVKGLSRSKSDISQLKKLVEKDPDLRSLASVVGKNPTQLSAKQVQGVQFFIKKHPEDGLHIIYKVIYGGFAILFLLLTAGLVTVIAKTATSNN